MFAHILLDVESTSVGHEKSTRPIARKISTLNRRGIDVEKYLST